MVDKKLKIFSRLHTLHYKSSTCYSATDESMPSIGANWMGTGFINACVCLNMYSVLDWL